MNVEKGAIKRRNYWDAAYVSGYVMGLLAMDLTSDEAERAPVYFVWGSKGDISGFDEFKLLVERADLHKGAAAQGERRRVT